MHSVTPWLAVIGIGENGLDGLNSAALRLIAGAELLVGGDRHLDKIPASLATGERLRWAKPFDAAIQALLSRRGMPVAVLASGDPMEYGVGATLARHVPPEEMIVLPQPGAFSQAAATLGWPLQELKRLTVHGRPMDRVALHLAPGQRLLILSENGDTPQALARWLHDRDWGLSTITVLEHLGGPEARMFTACASDFPDRRFADLNTIAVQCSPATPARILPRLAGLPDGTFHHDGQLTKRVVRAATLASLAPMPGELLWDVGAGCGSIGIEWMRGAEGAAAIAIERSADRCRLIALNAAELGVPDLAIIEGQAAEHLDGLPPPDAIFIGGGLESALVETLWDLLKPGGRLVANAVTVEGEAVLFATHARFGGELTRIALSHAENLASHHLWRSSVPVTQLATHKPTQARRA
ncbi:MAG TPA: precorrin-6y C5,15-methyltransferase (decarboxylating) subunit CbiE [Stellaceae bacterium]|nr:precorrin-6y C5,15-methyltransferase (decarboxylating) subunit CbiE [Stellaceae bacterium]